MTTSCEGYTPGLSVYVERACRRDGGVVGEGKELYREAGAASRL